MKKNFTVGGAILLGFVLLQSCTYDKEMLLSVSDCADTVNVSYVNKVHTLLVTHCFSCHGNGANEGGISLDTYDQVKTLALNGSLLGAISHTQGYSPMPAGADKLSDCNIAAVRNWIAEGTQNN